MAADATALVADIIDTHHDYVWARLPFLGPMARRFDRERGGPGVISALVVRLHRLLFAHLDREDRALLRIACAPTTDDPATARLRAEHDTICDLLDQLQGALGPPRAAGPAELRLRDELASLERHIRDQVRLEEAVLAHRLPA